MSHDSPAATDVMRAMVAAFDTGDVTQIEEVVHPEYLDHQGLPGERPITGVDGFIHVVGVARKGYTELSVTVEDLIDGADRVAARLAWNGVRLSGETTRRETIEIVRVESGRAVEHWGGHS
jgi:predicted ester cyclase